MGFLAAAVLISLATSHFSLLHNVQMRYFTLVFVVDFWLQLFLTR
jgi:hypothetical protein